jgi:hypothetical protein
MNPIHQQKKERMMKRKGLPVSCITIMSKGMILLLAVLLGILCPVAPEGLAKPLTITVLHTNNVTGHLFSCPT